MKTQSKATAKAGSAKSPKIKLAGKKSPLVVSPRLAGNHNETFCEASFPPERKCRDQKGDH
jgi:hypothetical protein